MATTKSDMIIHSEAIDFFNYAYSRDWLNARRILNRTPEIINHEIKTFGETIGTMICSNYDKYKEIILDVLNCPTIDLNIPNKKGIVPLISAIMTKKIGFARELLKRGANPNYSNNQTTILHLASLHVSTNFIQLLLDFGADLNCLNQNGKTPSQHLIEKISQGISNDENSEVILNRWRYNLKFIENKAQCKFGSITKRAYTAKSE